jgi:hypothetical protein
MTIYSTVPEPVCVPWSRDFMGNNECMNRTFGEDCEGSLRIARFGKIYLATVCYRNHVVRNTRHRKLAIARRRCEQTRLAVTAQGRR